MKSYCKWTKHLPYAQVKQFKKIIIKLDKSIFIEFLHMCNWQKNRKNFEKRPRKHFFKGWKVFEKNILFSKCFFWILTWVTFPIWKTPVERIAPCWIFEVLQLAIAIWHLPYTLHESTPHWVVLDIVYMVCPMPIFPYINKDISKWPQTFER